MGRLFHAKQSPIHRQPSQHMDTWSPWGLSTMLRHGGAHSKPDLMGPDVGL